MGGTRWTRWVGGGNTIKCLYFSVLFAFYYRLISPWHSSMNAKTFVCSGRTAPPPFQLPHTVSLAETQIEFPSS